MDVVGGEAAAAVVESHRQIALGIRADDPADGLRTLPDDDHDVDPIAELPPQLLQMRERFDGRPARGVEKDEQKSV